MLEDDTTDTVRVRLTLEVTYVLNGEELDSLLSHLHRQCMRAVGDGLLTGGSDAQVEQYTIDETVLPEPVPEDALVEFMNQRIADGDLSLEDILDRLVRFGLMEPHAFIAEMRERMGLTDTD